MKTVDLALKAHRLRQNNITGWIHHSFEHPQHAHELIPIYENFCFVLTLFRTKTASHILEAKGHLEKLFAFQTAEGFPLYLHEYPHCKSNKLQEKLALIAQLLLKEFSGILGETLLQKLQGLTPYLKKEFHPATPQEWANFLIHSQLNDECIQEAISYWNRLSLCYEGGQKQQGFEPEVTLFDLVLGEWLGNYSERALKDHPVHLEACLIYSLKQLERHDVLDALASCWSRKFWGEGKPTHSALFDSAFPFTENNGVITTQLSEKQVLDEFEVSYFVNRDPSVKIVVEELPATTFQLGEWITVESGEEKFQLMFSCIEGEGKFWGHIHFGNRPGQKGLANYASYEAFDWKIGLRTIERVHACVIQVTFRPFFLKVIG
ncbi:MAG: hypothetical protein QRY72_00980 [Candidatus Rhabdochlamydia sp.]